MVDRTVSIHGEVYIPQAFILDRDRGIQKIYNGWQQLGRPTAEEIRMDLQALMSPGQDWIYSDDQKMA